MLPAVMTVSEAVAIRVARRARSRRAAWWRMVMVSFQWVGAVLLISEGSSGVLKAVSPKSVLRQFEEGPTRGLPGADPGAAAGRNGSDGAPGMTPQDWGTANPATRAVEPFASPTRCNCTTRHQGGYT